MLAPASAGAEDAPAESLDALLQRIAASGDGPRVSVADIRAAVGERGFGPLLAVTGLLCVSPLGIIPGVPTMLAATMGLTAAQLAAGRRRVWLPDILLKRSLNRDQLRAAIGKARPLTRRIDALLKPRLTALTDAPFTRLIALVCVALCLLIPPLELIPFAATGPSATISVLGAAIFLRDGLLTLLGFLLAGGSLLLILALLL